MTVGEFKRQLEQTWANVNDEIVCTPVGNAFGKIQIVKVVAGGETPKIVIDLGEEY